MIAKYSDLFDKDKDNKTWYKNLKEVEFFISAKGKRPSTEAKDRQEKYLGRWLSNQIKAKDKLPADRMKEIQVVIGKYSDLFDEDRDIKTWYKNLKEVDSFIGAKGKRPLGNTKTKDP